jgi:hypothetical protein
MKRFELIREKERTSATVPTTIWKGVCNVYYYGNKLNTEDILYDTVNTIEEAFAIVQRLNKKQAYFDETKKMAISN